MAKEFHVQKYPLLLMIFPNKKSKIKGGEKWGDSHTIVKYSGKMTQEDISAWLDSMLGIPTSNTKKKKQESNRSTESNKRRRRRNGEYGL
jgi:hypothetical protein